MSATILLVDDQPDELRLLSAILMDQGYRVRKAISGAMALKSIEFELPDLVLLDIRMPGMNGFELCSVLKMSGQMQDIPVIFLSGLDLLEDKVRAFEMGGADYITKPFQLEEVLMRIGHQLTIQQQRRQLIDQNRLLLAEVRERKRIETMMRQQARREKLLSAITSRIRQSLDLVSILKTTVEEVRVLLQVDRVVIDRLGAEGESVESVRSPDLSVQGRVTAPWSPDHPCWSHFLQNRLFLVDDVTAEDAEGWCGGWLRELAVQAALVLPILQGDRLWGLLAAHQCTASRPWQSWEVELIRQVTAQLAIAIDQSELYLQLQQANQALQALATLDGLTQVANRRRFDEFLALEWQRALREGQPITLILCDVDYFKRYNDSQGHQQGDDCLRLVAQGLQQVVQRPADLVARYGGEEFVVILPNTHLKGGMRVAEKIRSAIAELAIPHPDSLVSPWVTLSLGVGCLLPRPKRAANDLISIADQALYQAKAEGRDRVCALIASN